MSDGPSRPATLTSTAPSTRVGTPPDTLDVLFVDLPSTTYELGRRFKDSWSFKQHLAPAELHIGFRYMVSALRAAGLSADILFPSADGFTSREALVAEIVRRQPRLVGFTTYEGSLGETLEFAQQARDAGARSLVCLGGHLATYSFEEILRDFPDLVDVIVLGEGEATIVEVASRVRAGSSFDDVPGIVFSRDGELVRTAFRPPLRDLDSLPFPVIVPDPRPQDEVPLFITTSRGCYGRCTFCRSSHFGERWRPRDPVAVVDEIERACADGVRTFELVDDNFLGPGRRGLKRANAFAAELLRRGLDVQFHASCRVNDVDEDTMVALQRAGLISLSLGVESGVPRMLTSFDKGVTVQQNEAALRLLDRLGISTLAYIIFFDPWTTLDEVAENVAFLETIAGLDHVRFEEIIFRRLIPVSGTVLYDRMKADGLLHGDYLSGHWFEFQDERVSTLADFMESVDLRIERAFLDQSYRRIPDLYTLLKERVELRLADRALDVLRADPAAEGAERLEGVWHSVLRETFAVGV